MMLPAFSILCTTLFGAAGCFALVVGAHEVRHALTRAPAILAAWRAMRGGQA